MPMAADVIRREWLLDRQLDLLREQVGPGFGCRIAAAPGPQPAIGIDHEDRAVELLGLDPGHDGICGPGVRIVRRAIAAETTGGGFAVTIEVHVTERDACRHRSSLAEFGPADRQHDHLPAQGAQFRGPAITAQLQIRRQHGAWPVAGPLRHGAGCACAKIVDQLPALARGQCRDRAVGEWAVADPVEGGAEPPE